MRALLALTSAVAAFGTPVAATDLSCRPIFDTLKSEIESNYSAYAIEYRSDPERLAAYAAMVADVGARASAAQTRSDCTRTLHRYIDFFSDPHLFLQDAPRYDETRVAALKAAAPRVETSVEDLRAAALAGPDPVAGLWATEQGDLAILPAGDGYDAVFVTTRHDAWRVGDVRAHLVPAEASYDVTLYRGADRAPVIHPDSRLEGNTRLRLQGATWGRLEPRPAGLGPDYDPSTPRKPIYVDLSPDVGVLYLPSFDPGKAAEAGATIVANHRAAIEAKKLLIIDIRGNEGGSQSEWARFAPFYATSVWQPADREGPSGGDVILAAPRVIAIWELFRDGAGQGPYRDALDDLVARLKAAEPGSLVPFMTASSQPTGPYTPPELYAGPPAVAVITDGLVVSAGEAFQIHALRSPKVTVFGQPTMGSIDYWTVGIFDIGEGESRYGVGMPIGAASAGLPHCGYNRTGVPVDVPLSGPYDTWIPQVIRHYDLR